MKKKNNATNKLEKEIKVLLREKIDRLNKDTFKQTEVVFLLIITSIISVFVGYSIKKTGNITQEDKHLNEIVDNYNYIIDNYYDDIDKDKLVSGAIDGMINSLDDEFSSLLKQDSSSSFYINLKGTYEGIGIEIYNNENNDIVVYGIIKDSPAAKANLKPGDIIKKIDEQTLENTNISVLTKYVQENKKATYELLIVRDGKEENITIERSLITIKSVLSKTFEKNGKKIGYIYISVFAEATSKQFEEELNKLEKEKIDALIIDVRNNSGGQLTTAVSVISNFLNSKKVIYQIEKDGKKTKYYSSGKVTKKYPIAIIQNGESASASELLSSSLKESYGATVIGNKSYGKGTVQEIIGLKNGDTYKFTTKKWLTPNGNFINKVGITPDIEVDLSDDYSKNPTDDTDNQLQTAIDYLAK
ncbi:MAG: PDZ domain-containing protein [Bacilli bacterium]|nr:PDZ domain-containing protein [Bacilli bacterium]